MFTTITTACRYMWILQDQDGKEYRHSAGVGGVPKDMIEEAKAKGLEIWAEHHNLMGRVGKELGFVPLDNDASFVEVKFPADPTWGRRERSHFWITQEWYQEINRPDTVAGNPWDQERDRRIAYRREFLDVYIIRTWVDTFKGRFHDCEDWLRARGFKMLDQQSFERIMRGETVDGPVRDGAAAFTIELY